MLKYLKKVFKYFQIQMYSVLKSDMGSISIPIFQVGLSWKKYFKLNGIFVGNFNSKFINSFFYNRYQFQKYSAFWLHSY